MGLPFRLWEVGFGDIVRFGGWAANDVNSIFACEFILFVSPAHRGASQ